MAEALAMSQPLILGGAGRVAVIDVGSNSVRMVVYDRTIRVPVVLFNEKVMCGLGRGVASTGRLSADGVALALATLRRFACLLRAMKVGAVEAVATAAVRDADNGVAFVEQASRACGRKVRILSGQEEARLSALGVAAGIPDAHGLVGDLGGGSLELVEIDGATQGRRVTLPLGPLVLADRAGGDLNVAKRLIDEALAGLDWLGAARGRALYGVGGAWRALGRIEMALAGYPLHLLHQYVMEDAAVRMLCRRITRMSHKSLEKLPGAPKRRTDTLPYAALVLDRVVRATKVERVVLSSFGLREGVLYDYMPGPVRAEDPLLAACQLLSSRLGRFSDHTDELARWTAPLFAGETGRRRRLRLAACYIGDIGWRIHPDYRAEHSMEEVLRAPLVGLEHAERAMLALAVHARYRGAQRSAAADRLSLLADPEQINWSQGIGHALRLAHTLSGAAPGILDDCPIVAEAGTVVLRLAGRCRDLASDEVTRRLEALARVLGMAPLLAMD
jgi:exopolyphosphatase/guanosine-5'-triphosphate,3'-diphosphate pyrophosphatase